MLKRFIYTVFLKKDDKKTFSDISANSGQGQTLWKKQWPLINHVPSSTTRKKKRTLTEFSSLKAINAEIEECGHNLSVFFIFGKT